jgi:carboxyl-terminal processing protease
MDTNKPLNTTSPTTSRANKYLSTYAALIVFAGAFGMGIFVGRNWQLKPQITNAGDASSSIMLVDVNRSTNHSRNVDFNQFWTVWDRIKEKYVKQPVTDSDLFYGAAQGLVASLNDPYSLYFPPKAADQFSKDLSGELEGIGAEIGVKNNQLLVVTPLPNTPAEKSGLKPGDKILFIDKVSTAGLDVGAAVNKIRGKGGTSVTLTIAREGWAKSKEISITRAKINVPSVMSSVKPGNIAYIRVMQFNDSVMPLFNQTVADMQKRGVKGYVLDLRNNPGGYLNAAVEMGSKWVRNGIIVSEKGVKGYNNNHYTEGNHPLSGIKTVVLVNRGSASASEIVAGALQDHHEATLVGEKTYGKGSVQDYETFPDGSALKLTIAEWFTPGGKNINKEGVKPDIEIKEDWEHDKIGEDKLLDKALEILKQK